MSNSRSILSQPEWRIVDQSSLGPTFHALQSFAMDDTLCTSIGNGQSAATMRSWVHHNTIVLGIQDSRLPHLEEGISLLKRTTSMLLFVILAGLQSCLMKVF